MIHTQAALNTAKLIASGMLTALGVFFIINFIPLEDILIIGGMGFLAYMIYLFYKIEKTRLESIDKLNKL